MQFTAHHSSSSGNLYQVESDAGMLLIDPGVPISKIKAALAFRLSAVDAALCSHQHGDHSKGIPAIAKAGIDCFMLPETAEAIKFDGHRLKTVTPLEQFSVAGFNVLPFPAQHDVPNIGFLITDGKDKLMFLVDSFYCKYTFKGLTHIALAINYSEETLANDLHPVRRKRLYKSHMSLKNAITMLQSNDLSRVREIHLLHMSRDNSNPDYFKSEVQRATGKPVYTGGEPWNR